MGKGAHGWLKSQFHFSFADYHNPANLNFGVLRVLNDDLIAPHSGFDTHPHRDMEIVSYVVDGRLTHRDSMGNTGILERGHVQYMSAGTGVLHSEHNEGDQTLRILQLWIFPDRKNHPPAYGEYLFPWEDRKQNWLPLVSGTQVEAPIRIHQDAAVYATYLDAGSKTRFSLAPGRLAYLVLIEGQATVNEHTLTARDALESVGENLEITADSDAHILLVEMRDLERYS